MFVLLLQQIYDFIEKYNIIFSDKLNNIKKTRSISSIVHYSTCTASIKRQKFLSLLNYFIASFGKISGYDTKSTKSCAAGCPRYGR
jgi:hypothetical protein